MDLGLALCDSGDCRPDDAWDEPWEAVTIVCLVAGTGIGLVAWWPHGRRGEESVRRLRREGPHCGDRPRRGMGMPIRHHVEREPMDIALRSRPAQRASLSRFGERHVPGVTARSARRIRLPRHGLLRADGRSGLAT
jgi:hypothetical protein